MSRIVDRELIDYIKTLPCIVNSNCSQGGSDPHHIRTVASGGNDEPENVIPLCRRHHSFPDFGEISVHQGLKAFAERYLSVKVWLELAGWELDQTTRKWVRTRESIGSGADTLS